MGLSSYQVVIAKTSIGASSWQSLSVRICTSKSTKQIVVADLLFIVTPIVGVCNVSMFCCTLLYVPSSFAIILMGKRELVALLGLSSWCLMIVVRLFLAVPWVCLQFVIVVFLDHTHYFRFLTCTRKMKM